MFLLVFTVVYFSLLYIHYLVLSFSFIPGILLHPVIDFLSPFSVFTMPLFPWRH
jgi:hypothetical protein